jgi:hypothetical protein
MTTSLGDADPQRRLKAARELPRPQRPTGDYGDGTEEQAGFGKKWSGAFHVKQGGVRVGRCLITSRTKP